MQQKIRIELDVKEGSRSGELRFSDGVQYGRCRVEMKDDGLSVHRLEDLDTWSEPAGEKVTREERREILAALHKHEQSGPGSFYWVRDRRENQLYLPHPLAGLVKRCETICDPGCCGIDAFDFSPIHIAAFLLRGDDFVDAGAVQVIEHQLEDLQAGYGSGGNIADGVTIDEMEHRFPAGQIDDFVSEIRTNLALARKLIETSEAERFRRKDGLYWLISAYEPSAGDWRALPGFIDSAFRSPDPSIYFEAIFDVFERHGVTACRTGAEAALRGMQIEGDYETMLLRRYRQRPSAFGRMLLIEIQKYGQTHLERECIAELLSMEAEGKA